MQDQTDVTLVGDVTSPSGRVTTEIDVGARIGRYVTLGRLGAGAMGIVYSAYDPQLDRRVAIKLLNLRTSARSSARARLLREARALARLDHPNVVTIYDVGLHAGQLFLAMQHIAGRTLAAWLRDDRPRTWRDTLAVLEAAGRGLAAVHAAGMIHRDFKPENVMIGDDGVVRVMDFGLANLDALESDSTEPGDGEPEPDRRLTQTGAVIGTPAYMALEQFRGQAITARSDQFGFCVALHEALYGQPPFPGDTYAELAKAVAEGRVVPPRRGTKVPAWLRKVVLRGLAREPQDRFVDMHQLLAALSQGERRRRRAIGLGLAGTLALVVGLASSFDRWQASAKSAVCVREGEAIGEVWHAEQRERIEQAFRATGLEFATHAAGYVDEELDLLANEWRDAATQACRATTIEGRFDSETYDKASWCLLDHRNELAALAEQLEQADPNLLYWVTQSLGSLGSPADCVDEALLAAAPTPPSGDAREAIQQLRVRAAQARSLWFAGRFALGLERVQELVRDAADLDWPPLHATLALDEAVVLYELERYGESEQSARRSFGIAGRIGSWDLATAAATQVAASARAQGHFDDALEWLEFATITHGHASDPRGLLEINRLEQVGLVYLVQGEHAHARAPVERVLDMREALFGPSHPAVADSLKQLAGVEWQAGHLHEAKTHAERGIEIRERNLGPRHPMLYPQIAMLGPVLDELHEDAAARAVYARLFEIERERPLDESSGYVHYNYARMLWGHGNLEVAVQHDLQALSIFLTVLEPDHPQVGLTLLDLGGLFTRLDQPRRAEQYLRATSETGSASAMSAREALAYLLIDERGPASHAEARALLESLIEARRSELGPTDHALFEPTLALAELALTTPANAEAQDRLAQARALAAGASERLRVRVGEAELARPDADELRALVAELDDPALALEPALRAKLRLRLAALLATGPDPSADERALASSLRERGHRELAASGRTLAAWRARSSP